MLCCGEFPKDAVKSIPTTPNIQVIIIYNKYRYQVYKLIYFDIEFL